MIRAIGRTAVLMAVLVIAAVIIPAVAGTTTAGKVSIQCDFPGQVLEAGETATFALSASNSGSSDPIKLWAERYVGSDTWETQFVDGDTEVNMVSIPTGETKTVTFEVETAADTAVGTYPVRVHIGDGVMWLYVTISETHKGEEGTLELQVTDKDGEKLKGATVEIYPEDGSELYDQVMTTADGVISTELPQDVYRLVVSKSGYSAAEKTGVKVKCGITTDAGTVMLDQSSYAAEVSVTSALVTTPSGDNPTFEIKIANIGKADDTYRLTTENLPDGWYARYKESASSSSDISEMFVPEGGEKTLYLEAIPPYGTDVGSFSFQAVVESSSGTYTEDLTAKISGSYEMKLSADRYRYEASMGETVDFDVKVANIGDAGALTGITLDVSAPEGWTATLAPENITSLQPGESETVHVTVVPPSNIVASEYKITVEVKSDQGEKSDEFRIVVKEQSFAAIVGVLLLCAIGAGVWYYFRKYQRR